ncbi:MAG TPA: response regulator transcription factor [Desulfonatronum sp.]|nr:response regulator transcription factor [Desulfonatronum sp.]
MPAILPPSTEAKLSPRQRQILEFIRRGKSNNEIAFDLGIGVGTVKQHVVALFRKLKVTKPDQGRFPAQRGRFFRRSLTAFQPGECCP